MPSHRCAATASTRRAARTSGGSDQSRDRRELPLDTQHRRPLSAIATYDAPWHWPACGLRPAAAHDRDGRRSIPMADVRRGRPPGWCLGARDGAGAVVAELDVRRRSEECGLRPRPRRQVVGSAPKAHSRYPEVRWITAPHGARPRCSRRTAVATPGRAWPGRDMKRERAVATSGERRCVRLLVMEPRRRTGVTGDLRSDGRPTVERAVAGCEAARSDYVEMARPASSPQPADDGSAYADFFFFASDSRGTSVGGDVVGDDLARSRSPWRCRRGRVRRTSRRA